MPAPRSQTISYELVEKLPWTARVEAAPGASPRIFTSYKERRVLGIVSRGEGALGGRVSQQRGIADQNDRNSFRLVERIELPKRN